MDVKSFSPLESSFLSKFNEGMKTFELLKENVPYNEKTLIQVIESLLSKHVIKYNTNSKEYEYDSPIIGEKIILDGNVMLPTTIIKTKDKMLVCRGEWYTFPLDFDIRRIIWNVKLPSKQNSTLVELIKESVLKEKKSRIVQLSEYKNLVGKDIPYSQQIKLLINSVGVDSTDINMKFIMRLNISDTGGDFIEFKGFSVRSEIKTEDLIGQLRCKIEDQNFQQIGLNRVFNFSDFVFSGNEIPYLVEKDAISYVKITGIRSKIELTYYKLNSNGEKQKQGSQEFIEISEGITEIKNLFVNFANQMLLDLDFLIELAD